MNKPETIVRKRAIIYCRVSTDKQEQDGESLEYQEEKCHGYAALHDMDVLLVLKEAKSGFVHYSLREKLTLARQFIREQMADVIIVWDLRRFSRNFVHSAMIFEEEIGQRKREPLAFYSIVCYIIACIPMVYNE